MMLPIILSSIAATAIVAERLWTLRKSRVAPPELLGQVWKQIKGKQLSAQKLKVGTVFGMIQIFGAFMDNGMANSPMLAAGISKALITTAAGLLVAIPAVFFHRYLLRRVDELVIAMEQEAIKLVEVVQGDREVDYVEEGKA